MSKPVHVVLARPARSAMGPTLHRSQGKGWGPAAAHARRRRQPPESAVSPGQGRLRLMRPRLRVGGGRARATLARPGGRRCRAVVARANKSEKGRNKKKHETQRPETHSSKKKKHCRLAWARLPGRTVGRACSRASPRAGEKRAPGTFLGTALSGPEADFAELQTGLLPTAVCYRRNSSNASRMSPRSGAMQRARPTALQQAVSSKY